MLTIYEILYFIPALIYVFASIFNIFNVFLKFTHFAIAKQAC